MLKRTLVTLLSLFIFTTTVNAETPDIRDAVTVLNIAEKQLDYDEKLDMNSDGIISFEDCIIILKNLFDNDNKADKKLNVTINNKTFTIDISDTKAAEEFAKLCPKTFTMSELNGNEKFVYTDISFTAASQKIGHINVGDIMLYGDDCIVLFYESFDTPYSYTKIGHINNTEGLKEIVGKGSIVADFSYDS